MKIQAIEALQIYDSRGKPTVEAAVRLDSGAIGRGLVPSGASRGSFEAWELRDGDPSRFQGTSVLKAVQNIEHVIAPALLGRNASNQSEIDSQLIRLDGTANKSKLGANAVLAVSLACASAAAAERQQPLYEYLGGHDARLLPMPEIQIIGGGAHAGFRCDVQDFMITPVGADSASAALEIVFNVYHTAAKQLRDSRQAACCCCEGGFWSDFASHQAIFEFLGETIRAAGYEMGREVALSLDIAASELWNPDTRTYDLSLEKQSYSSQQFAALIAEWCKRWSVISVEDPMAEEDVEGWSTAAELLADNVQLIGDDLFTTNPERIREGINRKLANAVLIKPNQIGTVTETLEAIEITKQAGWAPVVSARSGETEDVFITHLAVATNAGQLKVGSFSRSERMAKWNEMLRIERALGKRARFSRGPAASTSSWR